MVYPLRLVCLNTIYEWSTGDTSRIITVSKSAIYTGTIGNRCGISADSIAVSIKYAPSIRDVIDGDTVLCDNGALKTTTLSVISQFLLLWSTRATSDSIFVALPGQYSVMEYSECGTNTDYVYVSGCKGLIAFPTAFSPNGDGKNDVFRPVIQDVLLVSDYSVSIFNR